MPEKKSEEVTHPPQPLHLDEKSCFKLPFAGDTDGILATFSYLISPSTTPNSVRELAALLRE